MRAVPRGEHNLSDDLAAIAPRGSGRHPGPMRRGPATELRAARRASVRRC